MDIGLILIGVLALAVGWKLKTQKNAGWVGFGYIALVVYVISFFAFVLTSVAVSEAIGFLGSLRDGGGLPELSSEMIIMGIGIFIMWLVVSVAFIGILLYALGVKMDSFFKFVRNLGSYFFIPLLMIGFEALLIFALINGNDVPMFATALLIFFILVLGLGIWGYLKMTFFSKAKIKWVRTGNGSWYGDWVTPEDEALEEQKVEEKKKRQDIKMVPLNEKYLKGTDNYKKDY